MESLIKADIFFFISSIATVVLAVMVAVLLFYLIRAGKSLNNLLEILKNNLNASEEFVSDLRERMESNIIFRTFFPPAKKSKKKPKKSE